MSPSQESLIETYSLDRNLLSKEDQRHVKMLCYQSKEASYLLADLSSFYQLLHKTPQKTPPEWVDSFKSKLAERWQATRYLDFSYTWKR